jgi:PD-(D/E)XK nuclease superfamily
LNPASVLHLWMTLHFGLDFDGPIYRPHTAAESGVLWAGPRRLLRWLEGHLGCGGWASNADYLRIELYRQALLQHQSEAAEVPFYAASFEADRFATAQVLLAHRDALVAAGWNPELMVARDLPARLKCFSDVEILFRVKINAPEHYALAQGTADRWQRVLHALTDSHAPFHEVVLYEPEDLLPTQVRHVIEAFQRKKITLRSGAAHHYTPPTRPGGPLDRLQRHLMGAEAPAPVPDAAPDVVVLRARNDADLATFVAQTLAANPDWRPVVLAQEPSRTLEQAMLLEGLPAQGVRATSLARPALQVLKLAPAFLWEPVDVRKIMEFLTLPAKPFDRGLGLEVARVMAERPGLFSDAWFGAVYGYLEQPDVPADARAQYEFWFQRRRYPSDATAPKRDAIGLYAYLQAWAQQQHEHQGGKDASLLSMAEQARRIAELLTMLPEQRITYLELERIVRTIYEPLPVSLTEAEAGHIPFVHASGALAQSAEELLWWNCVYRNDAPPADFWQPDERAWLQQQGIAPDTPATTSRRRLLDRVRAVRAARTRLWLVVPDQTEGSDNVPSLLLGDLEAVLGGLEAVTYHIDNPADRARLLQLVAVPDTTNEQPLPRLRPRPQIVVPPVAAMLPDAARHLTPTGLDQLFYYPHGWYLRHHVGLYRSNVLSITNDVTLRGNLAHRFFEFLLSEDFTAFQRSDVHAWVDTKAGELLEKEGATFLLYGQEPERRAFLQKIRQAAWSLIELIRTNGWSVAATEQTLEGTFCGLPIKGKADLVLQRGDEQAIIDLKWTGLTRRKALIANEEDLQLVLYAHLLPPVPAWPHTGYFIIERGQLLARNTAAFREAVVSGNTPDTHDVVCQRILDRMHKTFEWRLQQLQDGCLEVRTARNAVELNDIYGAQLLDLLEMKVEDARYDDYRTLVEFMR